MLPLLGTFFPKRRFSELFTYGAVLEKSIWQKKKTASPMKLFWKQVLFGKKKKKQLTTTRGAVVSYTKQTLV
jgi:hypothetical protein